MDHRGVRVIFIRHGESTTNAGAVCEDVALVELTERGWQQARDLAAGWTETPDLIVTSPYTRARQTAQPTIELFPQVPVEVWPIQEFMSLEPIRWNRTTFEERRPFSDSYWRSCDPNWSDGPAAETFATLLQRTEDALMRLSAMPPESLVFAFGHGHFMQAVRVTVLHPSAGPAEKMRAFGGETTGIGNTEKIEYVNTNGVWSLAPHRFP